MDDWRDRKITPRKLGMSDPTTAALVMLPVFDLVLVAALSLSGFYTGMVALIFGALVILGAGAVFQIWLCFWYLREFQSLLFKLPIPDRILDQKTFQDVVLAVRDHIDDLHSRGYHATVRAKEDRETPLCCSYGLAPDDPPEWCPHRELIIRQLGYLQWRRDQVIKAVRRHTQGA